MHRYYKWQEYRHPCNVRIYNWICIIKNDINESRLINFRYNKLIRNKFISLLNWYNKRFNTFVYAFKYQNIFNLIKISLFLITVFILYIIQTALGEFLMKLYKCNPWKFGGRKVFCRNVNNKYHPFTHVGAMMTPFFKCRILQD